MNEGKIFNKLLDHDIKFIEHDERLDRLEGKVDGLTDQFGIMQTTMDKAMVILHRLDHERIFTTEWIHRVETDVSRNTEDIKHIKDQLQIN